MISDKLYELAFSYKKTRLWRKLTDTHIFAVKLSDGRIGYICIMGMIGEHCALALYPGDEAFNSWQALFNIDYSMFTPLQMREHIFAQNCLQCEFTSKDMMPEDEYKSARDYAREHGIRVSGKNAYPQFVKYTPECYPWRAQDRKDQEQLCEALAAAIEVARLLEETGEVPGLAQIHDQTEYIPLLELKDGEYVIGRTAFPEYKPFENPEPTLNDLYTAKLKKAKRQGNWECAIVRLTTPVQNEPDEVPQYPSFLMAVETRSKMVFPTSPITNYAENSGEMLNGFAKFLLETDACPRSIKVKDERTYSFFKSLCSKLKISLNINEDLKDLDNMMYEFLSSMEDDDSDEQLDDIIESVLSMNKKELRDMPSALIEQMKGLAEAGIFPDDMVDKLNRTFGWNIQNAEKPQIKVVSDHSYVVSVSLRAGCYRHIRIACNATLEELSMAILDAFEFDNDHAHAFFMDNKAWSNIDSYFMRGMNASDRTTDVYTLEDTGIYEGRRFLYLFDFGDEWRFQCKVLRVVDEYTEEPVVIRSKGEAPEQYPVWDEDE